MKVLLKKKPLYESFDFDDAGNDIETEMSRINDQLDAKRKIARCLDYQSILTNICTFLKNNIGNPKFYDQYMTPIELKYSLDSNEETEISCNITEGKIVLSSYLDNIYYEFFIDQKIILKDPLKREEYKELISFFDKAPSNIKDAHIRTRSNVIRLYGTQSEESVKNLKIENLLKMLDLVETVMNDVNPYKSDLENLKIREFGKEIGAATVKFLKWLGPENLKIKPVKSGYGYTIKKSDYSDITGLKYPVFFMEGVTFSSLNDDESTIRNCGISILEVRGSHRNEVYERYLSDIKEIVSKYGADMDWYQFYQDASWIQKIREWINKVNQLVETK